MGMWTPQQLMWCSWRTFLISPQEIGKSGEIKQEIRILALIAKELNAPTCKAPNTKGKVRDTLCRRGR